MGLMVPFDLENWMRGVLTKYDCSVFVANTECSQLILISLSQSS